MSKKNKTIEVTVREAQQNGLPVTEVLVGKNVVGTVSDVAGKIEAQVESERFRAKSIDDGIELVLRQYNLHN